MHRFISLLLCLFFHSNSLANNTEAVFNDTRDAIVQIRVIDLASGSKTSIGSGFRVDDQRLITNFHVIAELLFEPDKHKATFRDADGNEGAVQLIGVDVIHDLAVLNAPDSDAPQLAIAVTPPANGERLWAMGNPLDLGLTIVEGTYNGLLEQSLYEKIHFTGSINPGMSGGPTLNARREIIGVNVATAGNQIGFLVPATHVTALLSSGDASKQNHEELVEQVRLSLLSNQDTHIHRLTDQAFVQEQFGDYRVPGKLGDFLNCWGGTDSKPDSPFNKSFKTCQSTDNIFLRGGHSTGSLSYRHELFQDRKLGRTRFYSMLERHLESAHTWHKGHEQEVTSFACKTQRLGKKTSQSKLVTCLRSYKRLEGLYDLFVAGTSLDHDQQALFSSLSLSGISARTTDDFLRRYLGALEWIQ